MGDDQSSGQSAIKEEVFARTCLKPFLIPGTVLRHLTCIVCFHPPYYPETGTEDDVEI